MAVETDVRPSDGAHLVHFYDDDRALAAVIGEHLGVGAAHSETAVVIAAPAVIQALADVLAASEIDLAAARADGRVVIVDATEMLGQFMVRGAPDAVAFDASVGQVMRDAGARGRGVRAYGEMVALLWSEGNVAGAVELERLWDSLAEEVTFSLLCAYPTELVAGVHGAETYAEVCDLHTGVVAGAPSPRGCEVVRRFAKGPHASRLARRFVVDTLRSWGRDDVVDDAALVVAELATNAFLHARSDLTVGMARGDGGVTVVVGDASTTLPAPRDAHATSPGGRGMLLVDGIARRWGCDIADSGKFVWADLGGEGATGEEEGVA